MNFRLKDHLGQTPFVVAMGCRDNSASAAILAREPSAAEQFDNKGRNYLHAAIMNSKENTLLPLIFGPFIFGHPPPIGPLLFSASFYE